MRADVKRIGLVGCGQQSTKHVDGLLAAAPAIEIVAADLDPGAARRLADARPSVQVAESVEALLEDETVAAVVLAVPTPAHGPLIRAALDRGKHYLVEKPLAASLEEARALGMATAAAGRVGMVGYIYRFAPPFEQAALALAGARETGVSAALGRIVSATFRIGGRGSRQAWKHRRATGGGAINEMLVHMLDLAVWYFGRPQEADLQTSRLLRPRRVIQGVEETVDAEDFVVAKLEGAHGAEILIQADLVTPGFAQSMEIQGENGSLIASVTPNVASKLFLEQAAGGFEAGWTELQSGGNFYEGQARTFLRAIREGAQPERGGLDGALTVMETVARLRGDDALETAA